MKLQNPFRRRSTKAADIQAEYYFGPPDRLIMIIVLVILLIVMIICAWMLGYQKAENKYAPTISAMESENNQLRTEVEEWMEKALSSGNVAPDAALEIIRAEYPDTDKLVSIEYPFTDTKKYSDTGSIGDWEVPLAEKAFTLQWDGMITAGIDLDKLSIKNNKSGDKLIVTIPAAEIITFTVDKDSVRVISEKNSILNPITVDDVLNADYDGQETMTKRAIDSGLLDRAQEFARIMILDILRSHPEIGSYYQIEFKMK